MLLDDIPLFSMLRGRLGYLSERQRLIAQNVANADTPGYAPQDLRPFTVVQTTPALAPVAPAMTAAAHLTGTQMRPRSGYKAQKTPDSETTLDGNSVVLEEEMMKLTQARMDYDAAIGFYQKSLSLLRLAARKPGAA
jgi:flagellar basal-body rod protein FlgB